LTRPEKELFKKLEKDYRNMKYNLEEQVIIVQDIGDSRSERIPWLHDVIRSPPYLTSLKDEKI
jgi:hypothetical protein